MKYNLHLLDKNISKPFIDIDLQKTIELIRDTAFSLRTKEEIKLYVRNHQKALVEKIQNQDVSNSKYDHVLFFLESHFENYIHIDFPISNYRKHLFFEKYYVVSSQTKLHIEQHSSVKLSTALAPIFLNEKENYSFRQFVFLRNLWQHWQQLSLDLISEIDIIYSLLSLNYNTVKFFHYITDLILEENKKSYNPFVKVHLLKNYQHHISRIVQEQETSYNPKFPNIKCILQEWIQYEILQHEKEYDAFEKEQLNRELNTKLETSMSVAEIAFLLKLLMAEGIITNKTQTEVVEIASMTFKTKRQESISFSSLQNKFYNTEQGTKEKLKKMLLLLIDHIK